MTDDCERPSSTDRCVKRGDTGVISAGAADVTTGASIRTREHQSWTTWVAWSIGAHHLYQTPLRAGGRLRGAAVASGAFTVVASLNVRRCSIRDLLLSCG